jgi:beta-xylosidase
VSKNATGPYKFLGSMRPNGEMSRDMTLYKDDNGKVYQVCASENNQTMHINELTDDYLKPTGKYKRILVGANREAPAIVKHNNRYYLITSLCTGWDPNAATYAVADSIMGNWEMKGNPCVGEGSDNTFQSQSTYILQVPVKKGTYIFMADEWNKTNLSDSRYVWLPIKFADDQPIIRWYDQWKLH